MFQVESSYIFGADCLLDDLVVHRDRIKVNLDFQGVAHSYHLVLGNQHLRLGALEVFHLNAKLHPILLSLHLIF